MMFNFKTTGMIQADVLEKFNDTAIQKAIWLDKTAVLAMDSDTTAIFVCRTNLKDYKNDSWTSKGTTYHTIIVPHEKVVTSSTDEVTLLCVELTVERLLQWTEKKQKKATRTRRMKAAA